MMEASTSGGGGGGGPAPFLLKTYEMIDDVSTDEIVSWTPAGNSFIVWNPQEFASQLLPQYFKHNNFSSFIRQLNTYGFHKIDPELWEFANEDFMRDHKHLLKNIHRRKPMHSHSQSLTHAAGSFGEAERAALEEEIQRLRKEKNSIESSLAKSRQQQQKTKDWLEKIEPRVNVMEKRHSKLAQFVHKAMANPSYIENFVKEVEKNFELMVVKRKRRLPRTDISRELVENDFFRSKLVESSPPVTPPNPDVSKVGNKGSSNKLRLELSPANSNISRQGSSDDGEESEFEQNRGKQYNRAIITEYSLARESLELLDTCTSVSCPKDSLFSRTPMEEFDSQVPFHLNLTLYSTPLQDDASGCLSKSSFDVVLDKDRQNNNKNTPAERSNASKTGLSTSKEIAAGDTASSIPPVKVNDQFWEQFLTEKPGSLDNEEASSNFRERPYDEIEQRKLGSGKAWSKKHVLQQFSL